MRCWWDHGQSLSTSWKWGKRRGETCRRDKVRLDDAQQDTGQDGEEEDDENSVLERRERIIDIQELERQVVSIFKSTKRKLRTHGETDDQGDRDVLEETREAVIGGAPERQEGSGADDLELSPERGRVCKTGG